MKFLPDAARDASLDDAAKLWKSTALEDNFQCGGHWWRLRSTEKPDEDWITSRTRGSTIYQAAKLREAPAVAIALVAWGTTEAGMTPVEVLFKLPASATPEQREVLSTPALMVEWRRDEVLAWLTDGSVPEEVTGEVYNGYMQLRERHREALKKLGPFEIDPRYVPKRTS